MKTEHGQAGLDGYLANAGGAIADGTAPAVTRGIMRLFHRHDIFGMAEVPLPNGRRADIMAIAAKGHLIIVEIKCSKAELLGDATWLDCMEYCGCYFWAAPWGVALWLFESEDVLPERTGLIAADKNA